MDPAAEMGTGGIKSTQFLLVPLDQDFVALQIQNGFEGAGLELIDLAGENPACARREPLRNKKEQTLNRKQPVTQQEARAHRDQRY
jgi:hypothetical protein